MAIFKRDGQVFSWHSKNKKTEYANRHGPKIFASTRNSLELVETLTIPSMESGALSLSVDKSNHFIFVTLWTQDSSSVNRYTLGGVSSPYDKLLIENYSGESAFKPLVDGDNNIVIARRNYLRNMDLDGHQMAFHSLNDTSLSLNIYDQTSSGEYLAKDNASNIYLFDKSDLSISKQMKYGNTIYEMMNTNAGIALVNNSSLWLYDNDLNNIGGVIVGGQNSAIGLANVKNKFFVFGDSNSNNIAIYEFIDKKFVLKQKLTVSNVNWQSPTSDGRFVYFSVGGTLYKVDSDANIIFQFDTGITHIGDIAVTENEVFVNGSQNSMPVVQHYHQF